MKRVVYAIATSALLLGGATLAMAQGPGGSPGGDPKPSAKDATPSPSDKKGAPERKEPGAMREAPDKGKDDTRAGRDRDDGGKKAASPPDSPKGSKDSTASDRDGDKSDRKSTDTRREDETPKAAAPKDDKSDPKEADTRKKDETPKASVPDTDRTGKTATPSTADKKGVELTEQKRTTVHERLGRDRTRHVTNIRFTLSVGATVPRNVQVYDLPSDVVEIVPEYRSYRYVWVDDEIVIIDPARYVVIAVVGGGGRAASTRREGRFTLSEAERRIVVRYAGGAGAPVVRDHIDVGGHIPESVALRAFPEEIIAEVPRLRDYRFVFVADDIAVVDPGDMTVVVKIDRD